MKKAILGTIALAAMAGASLGAQQGTANGSGGLGGSAGTADTSPHTVYFIPVDRGVKLEVLDWGGVGRPLVLLAGLGYDAHVFDKFAPKLTAHHHVYGITRRGFGASSAPAPANGNYSADRLGDDVLAVIDTLELERPVLVGHAKAGQELSSIGNRHPEKVAGLIYLDAGYSYAYYDSAHGDLLLDAIDLRKKLDEYLSAGAPDLKQYFSELQASLPQFEKDVQDFQAELALMPPQPPRTGTPPPIMVAIEAGGEKYTEIHVPVLASRFRPTVCERSDSPRGSDCGRLCAHLGAGGCIPGRDYRGESGAIAKCEPFHLRLQRSGRAARDECFPGQAAVRGSCFGGGPMNVGAGIHSLPGLLPRRTGSRPPAGLLLRFPTLAIEKSRKDGARGLSGERTGTTLHLWFPITRSAGSQELAPEASFF